MAANGAHGPLTIGAWSQCRARSSGSYRECWPRGGHVAADYTSHNARREHDTMFSIRTLDVKNYTTIIIILSQ